jgi:2-iminobutanoate/2-iminopropanoate deaminase
MEHIVSHGTREAKLPFSDAVRAGDFLYIAGQLGVVSGTMKVVPGGIEAETRQMMDNVARHLNTQGLSFDNLVRCTVFLADMAEWPKFNQIYVEYFTPGKLPVRSAVGVTALALGARVEIECTAWMGK